MTVAERPMVETAQHPFELEHLLALFDRLNPARVLEIGVWHGGTLWHWLQSGRIVVGVDDTMFEADDWRGWAAEAGSDLTLIQGDSRDRSIVEEVRDNGPYDFIHIDASHDYASVKSDWHNYAPMVADGGVIVLHDVNEREHYGVSHLWSEIKPDRRTIEINAGVAGYCGIGVIFA